MNLRHVDDGLLRGWPLPQPEADGDKEDRGDALVVGGCKENPGAILLAAIAAFRAGAGRLCVGTAASVANAMALTLPEARVIGLPESDRGELLTAGVDQLVAVVDRSRAVLVGPGCMDEEGALAFSRRLLEQAGPDARLVFDAAAMGAVVGRPSNVRHLIVTPHAGEMAHLTGQSKSDVRRAAADIAIRSSREWGCVVVLKGSTTFVASPQGDLWRHSGGSVGLATSGSGDVLAGVITGLLSRGAALEQAAVWGVALHARAGIALARRVGTLGFMASELPAEVPRLMEMLSQ